MKIIDISFRTYYKTILLITILLILIFSVINYYLRNTNKNTNRELKEHYLTYFLPFYDDKISELTKFYNADENNLNYFKKKFNYRPIKFGTNKSDVTFTKSFLLNYIANSLNSEAQNIVFTDTIKCIDELENTRLDFCLIDPLTVRYYSEDLNRSLDNLRLVTTLYKTYIYLFTLKKYGVFSINDIPLGFKIGLIKNNSFKLYYTKFLGDLGYREGENYTIIYKDSIAELLKDLNSGRLNMIILYEVYPHPDISRILNAQSNPDIILLPFEPNNSELYMKKNYFLRTEMIDLNYLSPSYLPRKFGNNEYTKFKPNIKVCYTYIHIMSNLSTPDKFNYDFIKFYYDDFKQINEKLESGYKINLIQEKDHIPYHDGVIKYFKDYSYITNIDNDNCKYLVGKMECTEKTLKDNNLWYSF